MALYYCKKCGRVVLTSPNSDDYNCDYCRAKTYPVPQKYWFDDMGYSISEEQEQLLLEELVKTAPEFDQYLFEHRGPDMARESAKFQAQLEYGKAILAEKNRKVKCSYCGSANVRKIGAFERVLSTSFMGFGSKKVGKQFHCNHCGADF